MSHDSICTLNREVLILKSLSRQGCGQTFSDGDQLENHMEVMHSNLNLDCHWGGCEVATKGPIELKSHINKEHLNVPETATSASGFRMSPQQVSSPSLYSSPWEYRTGQPASPFSVSGPDLIPSSLQSDGQSPNKIHTCMWVTNLYLGTKCGASFGDENELQAHVDETHTKPLEARYVHEFVCEWSGCGRNGNPFKGKSKLKKHTYIHTGCK